MLRKLLYYYRIFQESSRLQGRGVALRRSVLFLRARLRARITPRTGDNLPARLEDQILDGQGAYNAAIVRSLPMARVSRDFVLILSDIQIRQCVHYRILQKMRYLSRIGIRAQHVDPGELGRIRSLLPFAHTVIIYRTALDQSLIDELRGADVRLVFECDDLIIGAETVRQSGILREIPERMGENLVALADRLHQTAQLCDELIVSTDYLARVYGKPANGLSDKPVHVIANFLEGDCFERAPVPAEYVFAYTTPSGSITTELQMLTDFLRAFDEVAERPWTLVTMGNHLAATELGKISFRKGNILPIPFEEYDIYLNHIARAEAVLIPLGRTGFNSAKTPIRLMDAALAGTQAIFSPVGACAGIAEQMGKNLLAVEDEDWAGAGRYAATTLELRSQNIAQLRAAVNGLYGPDSAIDAYRRVFVQGLGISAAATTEAAA